LDSIDPEAVVRAYNLTADVYFRLGGTDQVAKGPELREVLDQIPPGQPVGLGE
jgi:hypothetical protein